jgi:hypothetical protein
MSPLTHPVSDCLAGHCEHSCHLRHEKAAYTAAHWQPHSRRHRVESCRSESSRWLMPAQCSTHVCNTPFRVPVPYYAAAVGGSKWSPYRMIICGNTVTDSSNTTVWLTSRVPISTGVGIQFTTTRQHSIDGGQHGPPPSELIQAEVNAAAHWASQRAAATNSSIGIRPCRTVCAGRAPPRRCAPVGTTTV